MCVGSLWPPLIVASSSPFAVLNVMEIDFVFFFHPLPLKPFSRAVAHWLWARSLSVQFFAYLVRLTLKAVDRVGVASRIRDRGALRSKSALTKRGIGARRHTPHTNAVHIDFFSLSQFSNGRVGHGHACGCAIIEWFLPRYYNVLSLSSPSSQICGSVSV